MLSSSWDTLTEPIWSRAAAQRIDQETIGHRPEIQRQLMATASRAIAASVARRISLSHPIVCIAGPGNNGGDALGAASHLARLGYSVTVFAVGQTQALREFEAISRMRVIDAPPQEWNLPPDAVLIDGLTGLGFSGTWRDGAVYQAFTVLERHRFAAICSVDLPSGMAADKMDSEGLSCFKATWTVTFGAKKPCHVATPTLARCGEIETVELAFNRNIVEETLQMTKAPVARLRADNATLWQLCTPSREAHKYDRGHVLVLQGDPQYLGASVQSAIAAFAHGAGWVTLGQSKEPKEQAIPIELTKAPLLPADGQINDAIITFCKERQVRTLVVGPGRTSPLNRKSWETLHAWQNSTGACLVLDAGVLTGFWQVTKGLTFVPERTLLTPHLGEWQKMQQGLSKPFAAFYTPEGLMEAHAHTVTHGVSVIVKDAAPFIIDPQQTQFFVADFAGPALARAGSGDRLAGMAAAISLSEIPAAKVAALAYALLWSSR